MTIITVGREDATIGVVPASQRHPELAEPLKIGVFDHVFRRTVVGISEQPRLLLEIRGKVHGEGHVDAERVMSGRGVFKYDYTSEGGEVIPVVLKKTRKDIDHGDDPQDVRNTVADFLRGFQPRTREEIGSVPSPSGYEVHMPRYYGRISDDMIATEYIGGKSADKIIGALKGVGDEETRLSLEQALANYKEDLKRNLKDHSRLQNMLGQAEQVMVAGHTNPRDLKKGNWVFFIPYDYK